ncbi:hypothetical protein [Olivibacter sp. SDN3]|uniref:hypothetical protein n=1 Tax=Olivibacter sp. SDN3 TaxID=2764720 RepID=UPI001C9E1F83|nr:hypothetical protein [Olivibacter sp. SDN3]MDX3917224.1 hypothetical protein [Pseudosphingobacterium sp.]
MVTRKKILITVTTYPLPSRSYDELVCTAGILEDGTWIRIYPVPFKFLSGLRKDGIVTTYKFTWIELDVQRRRDDFRPESHSPRNYDFSDIVVKESIAIQGSTKSKNIAWNLRKQVCTKNLYTSIDKLIEDSRAPTNTSLATFKPHKLIRFEIEEDDREWKKEWKDQLAQLDLFSSLETNHAPRKLIEKIPYKFFYKFEDENGKQPRLMIEDWEIGQLYFNCLKKHKSEKVALAKVREQYWDNFIKRDIYLFLGTTKEWHLKRSLNPFVIIGVFYPPVIKEQAAIINPQLSLFPF